MEKSEGKNRNSITWERSIGDRWSRGAHVVDACKILCEGNGKGPFEGMHIISSDEAWER